MLIMGVRDFLDKDIRRLDNVIDHDFWCFICQKMKNLYYLCGRYFKSMILSTIIYF